VFERRRGVGLMQGLRCVASHEALIDRLRDAGLLVVPVTCPRDFGPSIT
jgi:acetylornithine/succinyldiaminopimelate/putrescine aminotransferase